MRLTTYLLGLLLAAALGAPPAGAATPAKVFAILQRGCMPVSAFMTSSRFRGAPDGPDGPGFGNTFGVEHGYNSYGD